MNKNVHEYSGVAFTSAISKNGWQVSVTARKDTALDALSDLEAVIAYMQDEGYKPFISTYNKAEHPEQGQVAPAPLPVTPVDEVPKLIQVVSTVETAKELGGVVIDAPAVPFDDGTPVVATPIGDGTQYLGLKGSKMDDILEGQSYEVLANCYSYDGTWVNFFNGTKPAAGHYYATEVGEKIFRSMFPLFVPVVGADHTPIPTGAVKLYMVGVKDKKSAKVYQNIKAVEDA